MDIKALTGTIGGAVQDFAEQLSSALLLVQGGLILLAAAIGYGAGLAVRRHAAVDTLAARWPSVLRQFARLLVANAGAIVFILVVSVMHGIMLSLTWPSRSYLLGVAANLGTAWVLIGVVAGLIRNRFVYRIVAISAWTIAALSILDLLTPATNALDSVGIMLGGVRVTPLLVIKTAVLLLLTLWAANATGDFLDRRVRRASDLTPSIQVLIGKVVRLILIGFAILIVMSTAGIDLSALAVFTGAVGLGLGFGLQKIVSNLVSGIILLVDKSIKPGDVISLGESFGWVQSMGARYTAVVSRDGREYLIPNEDFVTQRVVNWSYSNKDVRVDVAFGVSYNSDPHDIVAMAVEAAKSVPRVLATPKPVCHLKEFGDSSLNFVLRFWISDPVDGLMNVRGQVMLALWDAFKRAGVEIPFPQRDLNFRMPLTVAMEAQAKDGPMRPTHRSGAAPSD